MLVDGVHTNCNSRLLPPAVAELCLVRRMRRIVVVICSVTDRCCPQSWQRRIQGAATPLVIWPAALASPRSGSSPSSIHSLPLASQRLTRFRMTGRSALTGPIGQCTLKATCQHAHQRFLAFKIWIQRIIVAFWIRSSSPSRPQCTRAQILSVRQNIS